ncbi:MAG: polyphosphate:AMP phosphotransferase [Oscillospiraceae bacterium]|nr:polyphosphate:AMP phosphotransferase [Oscillospiraceae bacterium]
MDPENIGIKLTILQQKLKSLKIPVIILFEGWGASGKGQIIGKLIHGLDPRGVKVYTVGEISQDENRFPLMKRFWTKIPEYGQISIFDRSWYRDVSISRVEDKLSKREIDLRFREILNFEKQLSDDGYLILKFFLRLTKKEQKKRFEELESNKATSWRVTAADWKHHNDYDEYLYAFNNMIEQTDKSYAAWIQIDADDRKKAALQIFENVINAFEKRINTNTQNIENKTIFNTNPVKELKDIDPDVYYDETMYKTELKTAQKRLFELHNKLYLTKTPLIIVYEGWDAAGKGGNIKRLTQGLDPRGYEVIPVAAPTTQELYHQYLWRFWLSLPKSGHIAIYDRSWYGRVMVERIEGFCTEEQWKRAFDEINCFEESLRSWGAVIIKFWLHINKDEQLNRFYERQTVAEKQWKITDEDWRNREKWDKYERAVNEMFKYTNTEYAPWVVIESNNKKYARVKTINEVIAQIEKYGIT